MPIRFGIDWSFPPATPGEISHPHLLLRAFALTLITAVLGGATAACDSLPFLGGSQTEAPAETAPIVPPFTARATAYYPAESDGLDLQGNPQHTLQQFLADPLGTQYVSVGMKPGILPYGTEFRIPTIEEAYGSQPIIFKVTDAAFNSQDVGTSRINICVEDEEASYAEPLNVDNLQIIPVVSINEEIPSVSQAPSVSVQLPPSQEASPVEAEGVTRLSQDSQERMRQLVSEARRVYGDNNALVGLAVSQAIFESSLMPDEEGSRLAIEFNNLFGIKGEGSNGSVELPTTDYIENQETGQIEKIRRPQFFAVNGTVAESFQQHHDLMYGQGRYEGKDRYQAVRSARTLEEAIRAVYAAGYAAQDENYVPGLLSIYQAHVESNL